MIKVLISTSQTVFIHGTLTSLRPHNPLQSNGTWYQKIGGSIGEGEIRWRGKIDGQRPVPGGGGGSGPQILGQKPGKILRIPRIDLEINPQFPTEILMIPRKPFGSH